MNESEPKPITVHEAAKAIHDMVGTAANIGSTLTANNQFLDKHRFVVTLAREHNGTMTDHRCFVVEVRANEDSPVLSPPVKDAKDDSAVLLDEAGLLLLVSAFYDHDNKQMLIQILRTIRGEKDTGWTIDTKKKTIKRR